MGLRGGEVDVLEAKGGAPASLGARGVGVFARAAEEEEGDGAEVTEGSGLSLVRGLRL